MGNQLGLNVLKGLSPHTEWYINATECYSLKKLIHLHWQSFTVNILRLLKPQCQPYSLHSISIYNCFVLLLSPRADARENNIYFPTIHIFFLPLVSTSSNNEDLSLWKHNKYLPQMSFMKLFLAQSRFRKSIQHF